VRALYRLLGVIIAKIRGRPIALTHIKDVDGIVCGALYLKKHPDAFLVLAEPSEMRGPFNWFKLFKWNFVADLPCPGKAVMRADHHKTNKPCAEKEAYNPDAPSAGILALKLLGLENDEEAVKLAELSVDADTATFKLEETWKLNFAIKGANYKGKLYIARMLALKGLKALEDEKILKWMQVGLAKHQKIMEIADRIEVTPITIVVFRKDLGLHYRGLCVALGKKGAKEFQAVIVPKGIVKKRVYLGSTDASSIDTSKLAVKLGGGGHKNASGALTRKNLTQILDEIKALLNIDKVTVHVVNEDLTVEKVVM